MTQKAVYIHASLMALLVLCFTALAFDVSSQLFGRDVFSDVLFENLWFVIDWWSLLHLIFFGLIPCALFPELVWFITAITTLWEAAEFGLSQSLHSYSVSGVWEERGKNIISDLLFNAVGALAGIALRRSERVDYAARRLMSFAFVASIEITIFVVLLAVVSFRFRDDDWRPARSLLFSAAWSAAAWLASVSIRYSHIFVDPLTEYLEGDVLSPLRLLGRVLWGALQVFLVARVYRIVQEVSVPSWTNAASFLDAEIPFAASAFVPYVALFMAQCVFGAFTGDRYQRRAFWHAGWLLCVPAVATFLLVPIAVERPPLAETGSPLVDAFASFVHQIDESHNSMPSLHAGLSTMILFTHGAGQRLFWLAVHVAVWAVVISSALLTKQHLLIDVIAGVALAVAAVVLEKRLRK